MAEAFINVTEGSGKKLHGFDNVISAQTVIDEFVLMGEPPYPSYVLTPAAAVSAANVGDDLAQLMAGATNKLRIRRVRMEQSGLITAAATCLFQVARVTSAGTAGTAITPGKLDNADAAAGATGASGVPNATHGALGQVFLQRTLFPVQTAGAGGTPTPYSEWVASSFAKCIVIPAGITNGLVIRNGLARPGLTINFEIEFVETVF